MQFLLTSHRSAPERPPRLARSLGWGGKQRGAAAAATSLDLMWDKKVDKEALIEEQATAENKQEGSVVEAGKEAPAAKEGRPRQQASQQLRKQARVGRC